MFSASQMRCWTPQKGQKINAVGHEMINGVRAKENIHLGLFSVFAFS